MRLYSNREQKLRNSSYGHNHLLHILHKVEKKRSSRTCIARIRETLPRETTLSVDRIGSSDSVDGRPGQRDGERGVGCVGQTGNEKVSSPTL